MPQVRDLFFEEFYEELERVIGNINRRESEVHPSKLSKEIKEKWIDYVFKPPENDVTLISVDGGVQLSEFAYGGFIAVGRACALIHMRDKGEEMVKRVKIYNGEVFDDRDRYNIPGYVRLIAEYEVARKASEQVLEEGGNPLVLMDGSLYFPRFPYMIHDYQHHTTLSPRSFMASPNSSSLFKWYNAKFGLEKRRRL